MKIFVTGASGFLGKEILKYGIKKGYKIDGSTTRKVKGLYQFKLNSLLGQLDPNNFQSNQFLQ